MGLRATPVWFWRFSRLFAHLMAAPPAPRRIDPIAAALAYAIREAVRLEGEQERLAVAPTRANVVPMKKPEARVA
jgi:hypothetical protein